MVLPASGRSPADPARVSIEFTGRDQRHEPPVRSRIDRPIRIERHRLAVPLAWQGDLDVDRAHGWLLLDGRRASRKPRAQIAPADLERGPPEVVGRGDAL